MGTVTFIDTLLKERSRQEAKPEGDSYTDTPVHDLTLHILEKPSPPTECPPLSCIEKRLMEIHTHMAGYHNCGYEKEGYVEENYTFAICIDHTRERAWYYFGENKKTTITVDWREQDLTHGIYVFYVDGTSLTIKLKREDNPPTLGKINDLAKSPPVPLEILAHVLNHTYEALTKKQKKDDE